MTARSVTNRASYSNVPQPLTANDGCTSNALLSSRSPYPRTTGPAQTAQATNRDILSPPNLMDDLRDRQLDGEEIITSSDGSYRETINSSTYGFAIMTHDKHLRYATGGKIEVQSTEASSLRVELEGLITAYSYFNKISTLRTTWTTPKPLPSTTASGNMVSPPRANICACTIGAPLLYSGRACNNAGPTSRLNMSNPT